nr:MAG TPA_asm: hypothetical protein [Caudoviricetes sp.]
MLYIMGLQAVILQWILTCVFMYVYKYLYYCKHDFALNKCTIFWTSKDLVRVLY